jgi:uncharacterized protein
MIDSQPSRLLRVLVSEKDRCGGAPLYEAIVAKCRELHIVGATVFRGLEGFGDSAEIHRHRLLDHDLPIVITIVDSEPNINRLLPALEEMIDTGLIAVSDVNARRICRSVNPS